ncbi:MAG: CPBP family intramembrane glutamic endopeptidase [Kofleriaceae bacterium]
MSLDAKLREIGRDLGELLNPAVWRTIDRETARDPAAAGTTSTTVLAIMLTVAVSLTLQEYIGTNEFFDRQILGRGYRGEYRELLGYAWWSGWRVFGYVVLPIMVIAVLPGERIRDYHISFRGFFKHIWVYVALFSQILPVLLIVSTNAEFRGTYPFYRMANRSSFDLWAWEAMYAAQFVSLEFFFRGFMLQGLRRALGSNAIFVMLVPYCMIHYGKPMAETFGSIGAGLLLGTLAMRTRSIWGGVLIHIAVAMTMDILAMRGCPPMGSGRFCH